MGTVLQLLLSRSKPASTVSNSLFVADWRFCSKLEQCQPRRLPGLCRRNVSHSGEAVRSSEAAGSPASAKMLKPLPPLAILPFPRLVRSYLSATVSSSPFLLGASLRALKFLAGASWPLLNPDRNRILHFLLKRTVYAQFCAGETADEVDRTITQLKGMGYTGVLLGYAREGCMSDSEANDLSGKVNVERLDVDDISSWAKGTLATINMAQPGDFVALKFTGLGTQALQQLAQNTSTSPPIEKAITDVCELAKARGVRLLFDAEQHAVQSGINTWTIAYMKRYNKGENALVYGTYQAYKRSTPSNLARHLELAREQNFTLGVKLVRGAYLGSDPRNLFWDTIDDTHKAYDGIAESLMRRAYNEILRPLSPNVHAFPAINLVLASHNGDSVRKAQEIRNSQVSTGEPRVELAYGQLMGMAENISCGLVQAGQLAKQDGREGVCDIPKVYQYLVWGSVGECSQYLVRRAEENKDAVMRTKESRKALGRELSRRLGMSARWDEVR